MEFHKCGLFAFLDYVRLRFGSQCGCYGTQKDRFTCTGLTRKNIEPFGKLNLRVIDEGIVFNVKIVKHSLSLPVDHFVNLCLYGNAVGRRMNRSHNRIVSRDGADDLRKMHCIHGSRNRHCHSGYGL